MKRKKKKKTVLGTKLFSFMQVLCIYCNLFLFFPSLYKHFKPFFQFPTPPPPFISTPPFIKFWKFFRPPLFILTPPFIRHLRVVNENSERLIEQFIEVLAEKQEAIVAGVLEQHPYPSDFQMLFRRQKLLGTWLNLCCLVQVNGL